MFKCLDVSKHQETAALLDKAKELFKDNEVVMLHNGDVCLGYFLAPTMVGQVLKQALINKLSQG